MCPSSRPSRSAETRASPAAPPLREIRRGRNRMPSGPRCSMASSTSGLSSTRPLRRRALSTSRRRSASVMSRLPATTASRAGR